MRFLLARDQHEVNGVSVESELLQFGAFLLSVKQCFDRNPVLCMLESRSEGKTSEDVLQFHDCAAQLFLNGVQVFWHMPGRGRIVIQFPNLGLVLYTLPAFAVTDASRMLAPFRHQRSISCRMVMEAGVRMTRLLVLFVAFPLYPWLH